MRDIPDYFWEWTELDFKYKTGMRLVKSNVPYDILKKLVDEEKRNFDNTGRKTIINVDLETEEIIPTEEAVEKYHKFEKEKSIRLRKNFSGE